MVAITQSVGLQGMNLHQDVMNIQQALNKIKPLLTGKRLLEDGCYGDNTAAAILAFQSQHVKLSQPDGRIDPGGKTLRVLNQLLGGVDNGMLFPFTFMPTESYKTGMRAFGANRSGGRKHAGCDLYVPKGTPIRAIKDGTALQDYPFYLGTRALEVNHGDMIVRYGEISHVAPEVKPGAKIKRGQVIAYVGELVFANGTKMAMLHIEFFKGTASGPLTVSGALPYKRRADLLDPTSYLDSASMK